MISMLPYIWFKDVLCQQKILLCAAHLQSNYSNTWVTNNILVNESKVILNLYI